MNQEDIKKIKEELTSEITSNVMTDVSAILEEKNSQISDLNSQISELKRQVYKNQFSNLYVFNEQVQFRSDLIFPKLDTPIATSTTDSAGKIMIKDSTGTVRAIPYY